jgi:hypothetical protein
MPNIAQKAGSISESFCKKLDFLIFIFILLGYLGGKIDSLPLGCPR